MKRKEVSRMTLTLLSISMLSLWIDVLLILSLLPAGGLSEASPTTTMYVDPASIENTSLTPGSSFTVDIMVSDIEDLWAWQVLMTFDPAVVEAITISQGDFLAGQPEGTLFAEKIYPDYCIFCEMTHGTYPGVTGSGWLGSVELQVKGRGDTILNITNHMYTYMIDSEGLEMTFDRENGYFSNGQPVGGIYIPVNKLELLAPRIGLASTILLAIVAAILFKSRRKRLHIKSKRR